MSKIKLKKLLLSLPKEDVVELVMNAYDARRETKDFFEFFLNPNEKPRIEKIKEKTDREFYPLQTRRPKMRYSRIHRLIADFQKLGASDNAVIELYIYYLATASKFLQKRIYNTEKLVDNIRATFILVKNLTAQAGLNDVYLHQIERIEEDFPTRL